MLVFLCTVFLALSPSFGQIDDQKCFPRGLEKHLLRTPNVWKLMRELNGTFYLVYYSGDAAFRDKLPCLSARKSRLDTTRKSGHYVYQYSSNTTVIEGLWKARHRVALYRLQDVRCLEINAFRNSNVGVKYSFKGGPGNSLAMHYCV
uniref:Putative salivary lipocalin n=1 Tax=Ixodes ricinus TaxID=34613 RepID=A0A6B0UUQ4_IXORI